MSIRPLPDAFTAKTFARPSRTFEEIQINYINTKRWIAGKHTWNDITLVLYDPIAPSSAAKVMEWCRVNFDEFTGKAGYARQYKENLTLKLLDPAGAVAQEWEMQGAWPREVNFNELDYASSEPVTVNLVIRYDAARIVKVFASEPV